MTKQEKATQLIEQFPWKFYISERYRPELTQMVEKYLEADTFENAQKVYNEFVELYYYEPNDLDRKSGIDTRLANQWYFDSVYKWKDTLNDVWLEIHGPRHTREEVMKIASDFWCERIFDSSRQDNGDNSDTGILGMMMVSILKIDSMNKQDTSVRDKAWHLIAEYYGKVFDKTLPNNFEHGLSVDYHPCQELRDILKKAGVDDEDIDCIVPIKTHLRLRDFDKSLLGSSGYRNFVDL